METPALTKLKERQKHSDDFPWDWDEEKLHLITDRLIRHKTLWLCNSELLDIKPQDKSTSSTLERTLIRLAKLVEEPIQRLRLLRNTLINQLHSTPSLIHPDSHLGQWLARSEPRLRRALANSLAAVQEKRNNASDQLAKAARVDQLKQQLLEVAERKRAVHGAGLFAELEPIYGKSLYFIWQKMRSATLQKICALISQGDIVPREALPRSLEWRLFDLLLLYDTEPFSILGRDCTKQQPQSRALNCLFHLTQRFGAEEAPHAWIHITKEYNSSGRIMSMVGLQRRWHEMKAAAVDALLQFWRVTLQAERSNNVPDAKSHPPALYVAIAKRYPHVMLQEHLDWEELVRTNKVVLSEYQCQEVFGPDEPDRKEREITVQVDEPFGNTAQEDDDDLIFVENEIETIDLEEYNKPPSERETSNITSTHEVPPNVTEVDTTKKSDNIFDVIDLSDDAVQAKVIIDDSDDDDWGNFYVQDKAESENAGVEKLHEFDNQISELASVIRSDILQLNKNNILETGSGTNVNRDLSIEGTTLVNNAPVISKTGNVLSGGYIASNINVNHKMNAVVKKEIEIERKLIAEEKNKESNLKTDEVNEETGSKNYEVIEDANTNEVNNDVDANRDEVNEDLDEANTELQSDGSSYGDSVDVMSCIDVKLIMIPTVPIVKLDQTQSWIKCSYKDQINITKIDMNELDVKRKVNIDESKSIDVSSDDEVLSNKRRRMNEIPIKTTVINVSTHPLEAPRNILIKSTKTKSYTPISLCKNPDFNTRLKRLSTSFLLSKRNMELLNMCLPVTIDLVKSSVVYRALEDESMSDASDAPKPRAVPKIDLPNINDVRRMNKGLLTAEVTPFDAGVAETTESGIVEPAAAEEENVNFDPSIRRLEERTTESGIVEPAAEEENGNFDPSIRRLVERMDHPRTRYKSEWSLRFNSRGDSIIAHSLKRALFAPSNQPDIPFDPCMEKGPAGRGRGRGGKLRGRGGRPGTWARPRGEGWWSRTSHDRNSARAPLTEDTLERILGRLQDVPLVTQTSQFCCLARRHRVVNDARRRNAEKLKRRYYGDRDIHSRYHCLDCTCCCLYLLSSDADIARSGRTLDAAIQAVLDRRDKLKEKDIDDDVILESEESSILRESEIKERPKTGSKCPKILQCKCKPQSKKRKTKTKDPEKEKEENQPLKDDYQEWIRQKNLASQVFGVKPRKIRKESSEKTEKDKDTIDMTGENSTKAVSDVPKPTKTDETNEENVKNDKNKEKEKKSYDKNDYEAWIREKGLSRKVYGFKPPPPISFRTKQIVNKSTGDNIDSLSNAKKEVTKEKNDVRIDLTGINVVLEDLTRTNENLVTSKEQCKVRDENEDKETPTDSSKPKEDKEHIATSTSALTESNLAEFDRSHENEDSSSSDNFEGQASSDSDEEPALTIDENTPSKTGTLDNYLTATNDMNLVISSVTSLAKSNSSEAIIVSDNSSSNDECVATNIAPIQDLIPIDKIQTSRSLPKGTTLTPNVEKPAVVSVVVKATGPAGVAQRQIVTRVLPASNHGSKRFKSYPPVEPKRKIKVCKPVRVIPKSSTSCSLEHNTNRAPVPTVFPDGKYSLTISPASNPPRILQGNVPPTPQLVPPPVLQGLADPKTVLPLSTKEAASLGPCADKYLELFQPSKRWPLDHRAFIQGRDLTNIVLLQVDTSVPPWKISEDTLILTETEEPAKNPQFWTMGSSPRILSLPSPTPTASGTSVCESAQFPASSPLEAAPSRVSLHNKFYLKLCDDPLVYAQIVTLVNDIASVRRLLVSGARLQLYHACTLRLTPLTSLAHQDNPKRIAVYGDGQKDALEILITQLNEHAMAIHSSGDKPQSFRHQLIQNDPIVIEDSDEETEPSPNPRSLLKPSAKKTITIDQTKPYTEKPMVCKVTSEPCSFKIHANPQIIKLNSNVKAKVPLASTPNYRPIAIKTISPIKKQNLTENVKKVKKNKRNIDGNEQKVMKNEQKVYPVKLTVGNVAFEKQQVTYSEEILSDLVPIAVQSSVRQMLNVIKTVTVPSKIQDSLPKTQDDPTKIQVGQTIIQDYPTKIQDSPTKIQASPTKIQDSLPKTQDDPTKIQVGQTIIQDYPTKIQDSPTKIHASPTKIQDSLSKTEDDATKIQVGQTIIQDYPTQIQDSPTKEQDGPTKIQVGPTIIQDYPAKIQDSPTKVHNAPTKIQASPTKVQASPTKLQASPVKIQAKEQEGLSKIQDGHSKIHDGHSKIHDGHSKIHDGPSKIQANPTKIHAKVQDGPTKIQANFTKVLDGTTKIQGNPTKMQASPVKIQNKEQEALSKIHDALSKIHDAPSKVQAKMQDGPTKIQTKVQDAPTKIQANLTKVQDNTTKVQDGTTKVQGNPTKIQTKEQDDLTKLQAQVKDGPTKIQHGPTKTDDDTYQKSIKIKDNRCINTLFPIKVIAGPSKAHEAARLIEEGLSKVEDTQGPKLVKLLLPPIEETPDDLAITLKKIHNSCNKTINHPTKNTF